MKKAANTPKNRKGLVFSKIKLGEPYKQVGPFNRYSHPKPTFGEGPKS